jgi:ABC-type phosphate/phosphonate transport system substrate-binding protein
MQGRSWLTTLAIVLASGAVFPADREVVRVGLVQSLFRDVPEGTVKASTEDFKVLMEKDTGHKGDAVVVADAGSLAEQLSQGKLQLGVFHGFEFAWVRQKYPRLRPLAIAVNQRKDVRAHVLVRADSPLKDFAGLQGKKLALPEGTRAYCQLYLERQCQKMGRDVKGYFEKTTVPPNSEDALDDVVDGIVQATLVDGVSLDRYQIRKPARFARLKELEKSVVFPPTVVAYQDGAVQEATLERHRKALVNLNTTAKGRQILLEWKLTHFEQVPKDYEQMLAESIKAYPPPESK